MTANNQITIIGRAGTEPALRHLKSGSVVLSINIAVNRPGKDADGNRITDWITCQLWNKRAENFEQMVSKGDLVSISGSLHMESWIRGKEKRTTAYVNAESFYCLTPKKGTRPAYFGEERVKQQPVRAAQNVADEWAYDDDELPPF